jgi:hypothetical protein
MHSVYNVKDTACIKVIIKKGYFVCGRSGRHIHHSIANSGFDDLPKYHLQDHFQLSQFQESTWKLAASISIQTHWSNDNFN